MPQPDPIHASPRRGASGLSIAGLILAFLLPIAGLVVSAIAVARDRAAAGKPHAVAVVGLTLSIAFTASAVIASIVIASIYFGPVNSVHQSLPDPESSATNDPSSPAGGPASDKLATAIAARPDGSSDAYVELVTRVPYVEGQSPAEFEQARVATTTVEMTAFQKFGFKEQTEWALENDVDGSLTTRPATLTALIKAAKLDYYDSTVANNILGPAGIPSAAQGKAALDEYQADVRTLIYDYLGHNDQPMASDYQLTAANIQSATATDITASPAGTIARIGDNAQDLPFSHQVHLRVQQEGIHTRSARRGCARCSNSIRQRMAAPTRKETGRRSR